MGTNCAPLVADLFLFFSFFSFSFLFFFFFIYKRDFMKSLSRENQTDVIEAFNSTLKYLDDLLNRQYLL